MILSLVSMTLLLLRNSLIPLYQSSNFVRSPLNHPGSGIIFFNIPICLFSLIITAGAGAVDISSVVVCLYSFEASSVIFKDPSHSDNASILFILLYSLNYMCFVPDRYLCLVSSVYTSLAR